MCFGFSFGFGRHVVSLPFCAALPLIINPFKGYEKQKITKSLRGQIYNKILFFELSFTLTLLHNIVEGMDYNAQAACGMLCNLAI